MLSTSVTCASCREELLEPVSQEDLQEMQQALLAAFEAVTGELLAASEKRLHEEVVICGHREPLAALCQIRETQVMVVISGHR